MDVRFALQLEHRPLVTLPTGGAAPAQRRRHCHLMLPCFPPVLSIISTSDVCSACRLHCHGPHQLLHCSRCPHNPGLSSCLASSGPKGLASVSDPCRLLSYGLPCTLRLPAQHARPLATPAAWPCTTPSLQALPAGGPGVVKKRSSDIVPLCMACSDCRMPVTCAACRTLCR